MSRFSLYARNEDRETGDKKTAFGHLSRINRQEGHNDFRFTGMIQLRHDHAKTVTSFTLTELVFDGDAVDFILIVQFFKDFDFVLVFLCLFRWSTQSGV